MKHTEDRGSRAWTERRGFLTDREKKTKSETNETRRFLCLSCPWRRPPPLGQFSANCRESCREQNPMSFPSSEQQIPSLLLLLLYLRRRLRLLLLRWRAGRSFFSHASAPFDRTVQIEKTCLSERGPMLTCRPSWLRSRITSRTRRRVRTSRSSPVALPWFVFFSKKKKKHLI